MDSAGTLEAFVLLLAFVAALYASVGHGGASGYLAVMALFGVGATVMRPSALVLNVLVSMIATLTFALAGQVRWRMLLPFIVTSVPMAFLGGTRTLPDGIFRMVVAIVLMCVALGVWTSFNQRSTSTGPARAAWR